MHCIIPLLSCLAFAHAIPRPATPTPLVMPMDDETDEAVEHVVLLRSDQEVSPQIHAVLAELDLHPDHDDVVQVFNNSAFKGFSVNANKARCTQLANMTSVGILEKNVKLTSNVVTRSPAPWGLERISVGSAGTSQTGLNSSYSYDAPALGQGADIYIIDTGINTANSDFGGRATTGWPSANATDTDGHGTHTAGIAGSDTYGVASKANIVGVQSIAGGSGSTSTVIAGMNYVIQQHDAKKAAGKLVGSVMSMSLSTGYGQQSPSFSQAISAAASAGVHVVVAAGNDGQNACGVSPAAAAGVSGPAIAVGSIGYNNSISSFSNTGPCVDVYAPGEDILSTWIGAAQATQYLSGTSMAAPHVTGIVAYQIANNATLAQNPAAMKAWITSNALKGLVGGKVLVGDRLLLANNGVTVSAAMQAQRAKLASMAA
ncbi:subtilisin-like protein [Myriangium duriaei CBS 260.36]|uniref:Subtilisin-like protein n=1 Tax=Myriangium duriaei CBS 260.36 TaxID=1168546 RepID=A0A9P4IPG6_9PEZI|nr:subtilisin-like protein [Myriangium duriaei CBS 260.36]